MTQRFYWAGPPRLTPETIVKPSFDSDPHRECFICQFIFQSEEFDDPFAQQLNKLTFTDNRAYAKFQAHLLGYGWLYEVDPPEEMSPSPPDHFHSALVDELRIVRVVDRACYLKQSELEKLGRAWKAQERENRDKAKLAKISGAN